MLKPLSDKQILKKAHASFHGQRGRCYNEKNPKFKTYGAKGIRVEYSKPEFMEWYLREYKSFNGEDPTIGRIDHSGNYSFENIRFESLYDNSMERIERVGTTVPRKRVFIIDFETGEKLMLATSMIEAGRLAETNPNHIPKYCNGQWKKTSKGFTFAWAS